MLTKGRRTSQRGRRRGQPYPAPQSQPPTSRSGFLFLKIARQKCFKKWPILLVCYSKEDSFNMASEKSSKFVTKPKKFTIQDFIFVKVLMPQFCIPILTNKQTVATVLNPQLFKLEVFRPVLGIRIVISQRYGS
jgi:hypothetical protein